MITTKWRGLNVKTRQELQDEIKRLWKEIEIKDERIKALDESRNNTLESCKILNKENKKRIESLEAGAKQIDEMCNSILVILAKQNGGEIRVPINHMELTKGINPTLTVDNDEYVINVKGDK